MNNSCGETQVADPKAKIYSNLTDLSSLHFQHLSQLPDVHKFLELNPDFVKVIDIFSFGTISDWPENMELDSKLMYKLQQLSLITYATLEKELQYSKLLELLRLSSVRELEDLVIDTVYADLIKARMDSKRQVVQIIDWTPRDAKKEQIPELITLLHEWLANAEQVQKKSSEFCEEEDIRIDRECRERMLAEKQVVDLTSLLEQHYRRELSYERTSLPPGQAGLNIASSSLIAPGPGPGPGPSSTRRATRSSRSGNPHD